MTYGKTLASWLFNGHGHVQIPGKRLLWRSRCGRGMLAMTEVLTEPKLEMVGV
jgi:hypothetical protein